MNKIEVKNIKVSLIKENNKNPKKHCVEKISQSIREMGIIEPIVVDENDVILAGHGRLMALKEQKTDEVEVIVKRGLTEKQKEKYLLLSNKLVEMGGWDSDLLFVFEEELLKDVGWGSEELDKIFNSNPNSDDDVDVDAEIKKITEPKVKLGDLYEINGHRILCGDSRNPEHIEKLMGGGFAKLAFSSPPYNMAGGMYQNYSDDLKSEEYIKFNLDVINNCRKFLKGFIFWNISYNKNARSEFIEIIYKIIKETGLQFLELIVWNKGHALPITSKEGFTRQYEDILLVGDKDSIQTDLELYFCGRNDRRAYFNKKTNRGITNYWNLGTGKSQQKNLLACFPTALPVRGIELMTSRGDIVLDPFLGSGTTLIASERTGRKCFGCEIDPIYVELTLNRWKGLFGTEPIKICNINEPQEQPTGSQQII